MFSSLLTFSLYYCGLISWSCIKTDTWRWYSHTCPRINPTLTPIIFLFHAASRFQYPSALKLSMMSAVAVCGAPNVYYCWCLQVCLSENRHPFTTAPTAAKQPVKPLITHRAVCSLGRRRAGREETAS